MKPGKQPTFLRDASDVVTKRRKSRQPSAVFRLRVTLRFDVLQYQNDRLRSGLRMSSREWPDVAAGLATGGFDLDIGREIAEQLAAELAFHASAMMPPSHTSGQL